MKTNNLLFNIFILILFSFTSCSKDSIEEPTEEAISIEQSSRLQNNEAPSDGNDSGNGNGGSNQGTIPIYQFYKSNDHLYTINYDEGINAGYVFERILGYVATSGPTHKAITRWYNLGNGDRVITTDVRQHQGIASSINHNYWNQWGQYVSLPDTVYIPGTYVLTGEASYYGSWQYEKILGYTTSSSNAQPVHTYYNHTLKDHIYLTDFTILGDNPGNGYVYEGISFYI